MNYEELTKEFENKINIYEKNLPGSLKGICINDNIAIDSKLLEKDKMAILAEEIGHYLLTVGNILDQSKIDNKKQERLARAWAYERLVPISLIIRGFEKRVSSRHELCEMIGVSESFFSDVLEYYNEKYGPWYQYKDVYIITFKPLQIAKLIK